MDDDTIIPTVMKMFYTTSENIRTAGPVELVIAIIRIVRRQPVRRRCFSCQCRACTAGLLMMMLLTTAVNDAIC